MTSTTREDTATLGGWLLRDASIALIATLLCSLCVYWYAATGWLFAAVVSAFLGFISAYVICYIVHEWGHQIGGVSAGADMPLNPYAGILLGQFDIDQHTVRQFIWLSWGGVAGYCTVTIVMLLIYFNLNLAWVGAGLATGGLAFVFQSLSVDLPQIFKVLNGAEPKATNQHGASPAMILKRTWQSWLVLTVVLVAYNLV